MPTADQLIHAYNTMLTRLHLMLDEESNTVKQALTHAQKTAVELSELSHDEAEKIAAYLKRDLQDAARYLTETEKELADWLQFDIHQIEDTLLDRFISVADQTRLEWSQLGQAAAGFYQAGEVAGPGTLICQQCSTTQAFKSAHHIQPCGHCQHDLFRRIEA